jgi:serine/threonine-protein kinase|nr:serine/threonine-protein kinase [Kofleriaceae bacterium]
MEPDDTDADHDTVAFHERRTASERAGGGIEGVTEPARPRPRPNTIDAHQRYVLGAALGRGGMGEVLTARDEQLGRDVAIKRMLRLNASDRAMARFFREASIQGRLDHPAIVPVHELGIDPDGRPFFVMKKLAGTSMQQRIPDRGARTRLLRAFAEVCLAVEFAHRRGVVHRDLKPDNIVLGEFGEVYVIDWGVARVLSDSLSDDTSGEGPSEDSEADGVVDPLRTAAGAAIGTPGYMAPEQVSNARDVDGRADVYALGCILFEILTGEMMHPKGQAGMATAAAGKRQRPSTRGGRDVPPELDALVWEATATAPGDRIATARELGERVQLYLDGDRDLALRTQLAAEHFVRAQSAFAGREDAHDRAQAMREAGRALALDPTLGGAAELVSRLMLEPPKVAPPELRAEIAADDLQQLARHASTGVRGFLGYATLVPLLFVSGARGYAAALIALVVGAVFVLTRTPEAGKLGLRTFWNAAINVMLVGVLARTFSPFLLAPAIACVTANALVYAPTYDRRWMALLLVAAMAAVIIVPWLGEVVGVLPTTTTWGLDGVHLEAPGLRLSGALPGLLLVGATLAMIASSVGIAYGMSASDRELRRKMFLQTWQLKQLVPAT